MQCFRSRCAKMDPSDHFKAVGRRSTRCRRAGPRMKIVRYQRIIAHSPVGRYHSNSAKMSQLACRMHIHPPRQGQSWDRRYSRYVHRILLYL